MLKILAFAGSLRKDSFNKKLITIAAKEIEKLGHSVEIVDIADYELPVYNQDINPNDFPENAKHLNNLMNEHNVWLISTPEHNYCISSALKNVIDFASRAPNNMPNFSLFKNKVIGVMAASPSSYGGAKALKHLRDVLTSLGTFVIPSQFSLARAHETINENDELTEEADKKMLKLMLDQLIDVANKMAK